MKETTAMTASGTDRWLNFDVHGRVGIRVAADAPTARQLRTMLACFATDDAVADDIVVTANPTPLPEAAWLEHEFCYTDQAVRFPADRVELQHYPDGQWRISGRGELLTSLVPILDQALIDRGVAMIHAATVAYRGHGIALPAAGGTGKTSVIAKLTRRPEFAFMGDDWAFLDDDGNLLGFEKPMFIKPHHRPIYPHLFAGARKPLVPKLLSRSIGKLTTLVHPFVVRYPALADVSRRWSPEHRIVSPRKALPHANFSAAAPLAAAVYVERYDGARTRLFERDSGWMVDRMIGNFHIEMAGFSQHLVTSLGAASVMPLTRHFRDKADVLAKATASTPCYVLKVPTVYDADTASNDIVAVLDRLLPSVTPELASVDSIEAEGKAS
jgi:hypothetical protein